MNLGIQICVFYVVVLKLHRICAECVHYYTLIETEYDDVISTMTPKILNDTTLMEYPLFKTTEEYKIIQDNIDCIIQISCEDVFTNWKVAPVIKPYKSTDTRFGLPLEKLMETTVRSEFTLPEKVTTTDKTLTDVTDSSDPTSSGDTTADPTSSGDTTSSDVTTPSDDTITSDDISSSDYSSTPEDTIANTETTTVEDKISAVHLEMERKKNDSLKTAIIVTSVLGGVAVAAILAVKGITAMQSGTYLLPAPTMAESAL